MATTDKLRSKLLKKLTELFQLDQPDLDFGFYRIMKSKAEQISTFIDKDLLQIIADAFGQVDEGRKAELQMKIDKEIEAAREYGVSDPDSSPKVMEARAKYNALKDGATAEADVYDHLYRFFERYYDEGDFISRRYYSRENAGKAAPFAIPYNGEEVKLHWANADQYYIKTAEYFSNYTFDLTQSAEIRAMDEFNRNLLGVGTEPLKVHFRIVDADEGEHGNVKATDEKKRFFVLYEPRPTELNDAGELIVNFEYKSLAGGKNEVSEDVAKDLKSLYGVANKGDMPNLSIAQRVLESLETVEIPAGYRAVLKLLAPTDKIPNRPLLGKYINQYTARNTCDYFIHKDLEGFLKRELDFYIKNEVMHLDDIENADVPSVESYLAKIKVIRKIAGKLIEFLAQLENFQKKLWLKKKFVTETNYCITLDRVPEQLYAEIASNDAQREEWVKLFAIDEITATDGDILTAGAPAYSVPLTVEFLKANDKLVLDTAFFSDEFTAKLIESIEEFDEQCDGLLIHSENFQALNLLQGRYREQVKCVYIDPPYNTDGDGFLYKDSYKHASWLTMISERFSKAYALLNSKGVLFSSIDEKERTNLDITLKEIFGPSNRVEELIWVQNTTKNQSPTYSTNHEYIEVFSKDISAVKADFSMFRETKPGFIEIMELISEINPEYPPVSEIETKLRDLFREHKKEMAQNQIDESDDWKGIYNYNHVEYRNSKGEFVDEANAKRFNAKIWVWREVDTSMPQIKEDSQKNEFRDPKSDTYRFYEPIHPVTGKPCKAPKRGWAWPYLPTGKQKSCFSNLAADKRIAWGEDEAKIPQRKSFLHEVESNVSKSVLPDFTDGEKELTDLFGKTRIFGGPKPTTLINKLCNQASVSSGEIVMDFFVGSGTTVEAVIRLNHADQQKRKILVVEMGEHFNTILLPRLSKIIYASGWNAGKPTHRNMGISSLYKYLRLESYEDTLNNIVFDDNTVRNRMMEQNGDLRMDYNLHYLLDVETRGSQSLLNIDNFANPTAYTLKVKKPGSDEQTTRTVDLVESFNYLLGLRLTHLASPQRFTSTFTRKPDPELPQDQNTKLVVDGKIQLVHPQITQINTDTTGFNNLRDSAKSADKSWWFRKVEGWVPADSMNPNNGQKEKVLIVWRTLSGNLEEDNLMLDEWFKKFRLSTTDFEFDTIYVNGSNNLPNLKKDDENWKVRLIEEEFHKKMWEEA